MAHTTLHRSGSATLFRGRFSPLNLLMSALDTYRSRVHLSRLDARMLEDIGVTPKEALQETTKGVWDVPTHWMR